jgi:hypothetical protein
VLIFAGTLCTPRDNLVATAECTIQPDITSILSLCRKVYCEAAPILYRLNRFHFIDDFAGMAQLAHEELLQTYTYQQADVAIDPHHLATVLARCSKLSGLTIYDAMVPTILDEPKWTLILYRVLNTQGGYFRLAHIQDLLECCGIRLGVRLVGGVGAFEMGDVQRYVRTAVGSVIARLGLGGPFVADMDGPLVVTLRGYDVLVRTEWRSTSTAGYDEVVLSLVD